MRKLNLADVTSSVGLPVKSGTLQHLQLAYQEALTALANSIIGRSADFANAYVLYGLVNSGTSGAMVVSAGAIYYNGEVFLVDAFSLTVTDTAVANVVTTFFGTNADPVTFTDGISRNVHQIRKIVFTDDATGSGLFDFADMLQTPQVLVNMQQDDLGEAFIIKFDQDKAVFFAAATMNCTIDFDFTNAVAGAVVRLKWTFRSGRPWTFGSGRTLTINTPSGSTIIKDSGDLGSVASNTNLLYAVYLGLNAAGNHEVSYTIKQV